MILKRLFISQMFFELGELPKITYFVGRLRFNICLDYFTITSCLSSVFSYCTLLCVYNYLLNLIVTAWWRGNVSSGYFLHPQQDLPNRHLFCCRCLSSYCDIIFICAQFKFHSLHLADLHLSEVEVWFWKSRILCVSFLSLGLWKVLPSPQGTLYCLPLELPQKSQLCSLIFPT